MPSEIPAILTAMGRISNRWLSVAFVMRKTDQSSPREESFPIEPTSISHLMEVKDGRDRVYLLEAKCGSGCSGRVFRARSINPLTNRSELCAIKIFKKKAGFEYYFKIEVNILAFLRTELRRRFHYRESFEYNGQYCIVFDLLGPSISDDLGSCDPPEVRLALAKTVLVGCLRDLAAIHGLGIAHLDCKPNNIMYEDKTRQSATLIDYANAQFAIKCPEWGAPFPYCPPENAKGGSSSMSSDIWSLACSVLEILIGYPIFESLFDLIESTDEDVRQIVIEDLKKFGDLLGPRSKACQAQLAKFRELMFGMLRVEPADRITAGEALEADFFT
jgi:serine/threonine protein kinase